MRIFSFLGMLTILILSCTGCTPAARNSSGYNRGFFYVSLESDPTLIFSAAPGGTVIRQIPLNPPQDCSLYSVNPAPVGPWIAVEWECTFGPSVELFNSNNGESHFALSDPSIDNRLLNWQPDGSSYYLQIGTLSVPQTLEVNINSGKAVDLGLSPFIYDLTVSPDSSRILFSLTHGTGFGSETWGAGPQGQNPYQLLVDEKNIIALAGYSPDGKRIAFVKIPDNLAPNPAGELWIMDLDGFSAQKIADADAGNGFGPAWSPDSKNIAFVQNNPSQSENKLNISIIDMETNHLITIPQAAVSEAAWSPDGSMISYSSSVSKAAGGDTIYVNVYKLSSSEDNIIGKKACCSGWIR